MSRERITVVDSKNHERVLGSIPASFEMIGRCRIFPLYNPRVAYSDIRATDPISCIRELRMDYVVVREETKGWTRITEYGLATSAKLEDLVTLRAFRLPGESERSAYMRSRLYA